MGLVVKEVLLVVEGEGVEGARDKDKEGEEVREVVEEVAMRMEMWILIARVRGLDRGIGVLVLETAARIRLVVGVIRGVRAGVRRSGGGVLVEVVERGEVEVVEAGGGVRVIRAMTGVGVGALVGEDEGRLCKEEWKS